MNNTITKIKNSPEGFNSRLKYTEERISKLEGRIVKIIAVDQKKRMKRSENSLRDPWINNKENNIHIIGVQEGERGQEHI